MFKTSTLVASRNLKLVTAVVSLFVTLAVSAVCSAAKEATFAVVAPVDRIQDLPDKTSEVDLNLPVRVKSNLTAAPSMRKEYVTKFRDEYKDLAEHLTNPESYTYINDWPSATGITALSTDNPPLTPSDSSAAWRMQHPGKKYDDGTEEDPAPHNLPRITNIDWINIGGQAWWTMDIRIHGMLPSRARGEVHVAPLRDWSYFFVGDPSTALSGSADLRYSREPDSSLKPFRAKFSLGHGSGGPSIDFHGEGVLRRLGAANVRSTFTTLAIDGKIPLKKPSDVDDEGGESDASEKIPDTLTLSLNRYGYKKGGNLNILGLRARTTGGFHGAEVVGYYSPLMGWFNQSHGFYGAEVEAGWRSGDSEFTNLRTGAPDRGNIVARLGTVVEWAPQIGGVNKNLAHGLRFYVRGRNWLDTYKNDGGNTSLRLRYFVDAEVFYNFNDQWRVFLRSEYGYVLPDLNTRVSRPAFVGVGAAF